VGRTKLCSIIGKDEFPLRPYGPSLGRAGEAYATDAKLYFSLCMFWTPITLKYILSNASFAFLLLGGCWKSLLENELSDVLRSLGSQNPR
jgi:hypothetical protein